MATPFVAATVTQTPNWVAAVRTSNRVTNPGSSSNPGFRIGRDAEAEAVPVTVTFVSTETGLSFNDVFVSWNGPGWTWTATANPDGTTVTYTATKSVSVGPAGYYDSTYLPGATAGITIKGKPGRYAAAITGPGAHINATFEYDDA